MEGVDRTKPYKDFPLTRHKRGQWYKKIRGVRHYFGSDWKAALDKFLATRDDLYAGRTPRPAAVLVRDLCDRFLTSKRLAVDAGEMSPHTWRDYYRACIRLGKALGRNELDQLSGADFEQYRANLAKTRGPAALAAEVQRVRSVFAYAFAERLIPTPVHFGSSFRVPPRKALRRARRLAGPKFFEAHECQALLAASGPQMRAMILLALNCGYGATDLAHLTAAELAGGWAVFPRPKTEAPRRAKLWPETVDAVKAALACRPDPRDPADSSLIFLTKFGRPWVRSKPHDPTKPETPIDCVNLEFRRLLKRMGMFRPGRGLYSLRHTYRTIADGCKDQRAIDLTMGHLGDQHISSAYVERVEDARLEAVAEHVRAWLWPRS